MKQGKVAYISTMEDGQRLHLVADTSITTGTWHNVTLTVSGQNLFCVSDVYQLWAVGR